jgi:hypothetical protein
MSTEIRTTVVGMRQNRCIWQFVFTKEHADHKTVEEIMMEPYTINLDKRPEEEREKGISGARKSSNSAQETRCMVPASSLERHEMRVEGEDHSDRRSGIAF